MEWLRQWQLPITSAYQEQTIRPRPVTTASPTSPDLCTGPIPLSACRSIDNDIVSSNSLEQRLIKPQPHTSLAFSLLFSPQRPRAGEKKKRKNSYFFCITEGDDLSRFSDSH